MLTKTKAFLFIIHFCNKNLYTLSPDSVITVVLFPFLPCILKSSTEDISTHSEIFFTQSPLYSNRFSWLKSVTKSPANFVESFPLTGKHQILSLQLFSFSFSMWTVKHQIALESQLKRGWCSLITGLFLSIFASSYFKTANLKSQSCAVFRSSLNQKPSAE